MKNDNINLEKDKNRLLSQMEKEIKELKCKIENSTKANFKTRVLRGLNYTYYVGRLVAPYVVSAGIVFSIFAALKITPFIRDNRQMELEIKKEIDSNNRIKIEEKYEEFDDTTATLTYVSNWKKEDDNYYKRVIKTYRINIEDEELITKLVNDKNVTTIEDVLGKPISTKYESKNNLTEEEINEEPYLNAIIYSKDSEKYLTVKESAYNNLLLTIAYIFAALSVECIIKYFRGEYSHFDFYSKIYDVKHIHPLLDREELEKELKIKTDNYKRITR